MECEVEGKPIPQIAWYKVRLRKFFYGAMSKFYCAEVAKKIALEGVQILGGYGYTMEYDAQRYLRDVLILSIGGGTTQIQKNIVGRTLGL